MPGRSPSTSPRRRCAALAAVAAVCASWTAQAEPCPPPSGEVIDARIDHLESIFEAHAPALDLWWTGFVALHAGMAASMSVVQNYQAEPARRETAVGIVGSALGAATLFAVTPPVVARARRLGARPGPEAAIEARRRYLAAAEALLAEQAKKSRFARSWLARGIALAYTTSAALFVWLALDRPWGAARNFLGGLVIGQGRILLHPTGAADAWDAYRARYVERCAAPPMASARLDPPSPQLGFVAGPRGLALTLTF